jgi:hypothetical protein
MNFDELIFYGWLWSINPEIIWIGYNNYPEKVRLDEPPLEKTKSLIKRLESFTDVRLKTMREPGRFIID